MGERFEIDDGFSTVVCLRLRRHTDQLAVNEPEAQPPARFFGKEICGERVFVLRESEPGPLPLKCIPAYARLRSKIAADVVDLTSLNAESGFRPIRVRSFDEKLGLHGLADGRFVDITDAFSLGRARFERPLHEILEAKSEGQNDVEDVVVVDVQSPARGRPRKTLG